MLPGLLGAAASPEAAAGEAQAATGPAATGTAGPGGHVRVMKALYRDDSPAPEDLGFAVAFGTALRERVYLDFVYRNEGHAEDGHRDGFGLQLAYRFGLSPRLDAELAGGPLWTFNTTNQADGTEVNDKRPGVIVSGALVYRLHGRLGLRAQYDYIDVHRSFGTRSVLVGLHYETGHDAPEWEALQAPIEVTMMAGLSKMNSGAVSASAAYQVELRSPWHADFAWSVSALSERDNGILSRDGFALQGWYVKQFSARWKLSAGIGPMLASEREEGSRKTRLDGVISLEAARTLRGDAEAGLRFSRVASAAGRARDSDLGLLFARLSF